MNKFYQKFDGYKFRQAMRAIAPTNTNFFGGDWELCKELRLQVAANDTARMWRHLWQKLAQKVGASND